MSGDTKAAIISDPKDLSTTGIDAEVGWQSLEAGRVCGESREIMWSWRGLRLESYSDNVEGCDWKNMRLKASCNGQTHDVPRSDVRTLPTVAEIMRCPVVMLSWSEADMSDVFCS